MTDVTSSNNSRLDEETVYKVSDDDARMGGYSPNAHNDDQELLDIRRDPKIKAELHDDTRVSVQDVVKLASLTPDDILVQLGGCGVFQVLLAFLIQFMKIVVCWGMGGNAFFAYVPRWRCIDYNDGNNTSDDLSTLVNNTTSTSIGPSNRSEPLDYWNQKCHTFSGEKCINFEFEDTIHTLVSEHSTCTRLCRSLLNTKKKFDLVCEKSWVTASIISMQMIGMMVGSLVVGNLSDLFGRKKPLIFSMAILFVFQLICYFATNWIMFAVGRVVVGIGSAFFLSIYCIFVGEYTLSKWRSTTISFPTWAIEMCFFTLFSWLLHNWEYLTLMIALGSLGFMLSWFFIPESFRWLIARDKLTDVQDIVKQIAKWNKRPVPDQNCIIKAFTVPEEEQTKNYSILVLFRKRSLLKLTVPLMTGWFALGVIGYGIGFGIKKLSGNLFLNLFLFSIVSIPSKIISILLQNRIGRKYTTMLAYTVCLIGGVVVGVVQYVDTPYQGGLTNGFAFAASAGVDAAWGPMQTLTVEVYPTIARNTGFGFLSTLARLGAVLGPQFVYLEDYVPGLLYFVVAGLAALSLMCILSLPETMNTTLVDKISEDLDKLRKREKPTVEHETLNSEV